MIFEEQSFNMGEKEMNLTLKAKLLVGALALTTLSAPAYAGKSDNSLNIAFSDEIETLDYYQTADRPGLIVGRMLYDGLISKDQTTGEFVPELAEAFEVISDTEIDFKIRPGVKFHNGQVLTADDVVFTLNTIKTPEFNARYSIAVKWIAKAEKLDGSTVRLTMTAPNPLAMEMLAGNIPIYSKAYWEEAGAEGMSTAPIGTGPYRLVAMTPGVSFELQRFDDYYAGGQKADAAIEKINVRIIPETNTQYIELMNGNLDWIWRVSKDDVQRFADRPNLKVDTTPIMRIEYLELNPNKPDSPLADVRVRKAINHAINRQQMSDAFIGQDHPLIQSLCNPVQFGCETDVTTYDYDPDKARELLAEAGLGDGTTLTMVPNGTEGVAEVVKSNLEGIGLNLNITKLQVAVAQEQWYGNLHDMALTNWGAYGIGDVSLSPAAYLNGSADDIVKDLALAALVNEANTTMDREKRASLYSQIFKTVADEAYIVPLWTRSINAVMSSDLNLTVGPDEFVPFYDATWN